MEILNRIISEKTEADVKKLTESFSKETEYFDMSHPKHKPAFIASSTALLLSTGNAPGIPEQTGQVFVFGSSPN